MTIPSAIRRALAVLVLSGLAAPSACPGGPAAGGRTAPAAVSAVGSGRVTSAADIAGGAGDVGVPAEGPEPPETTAAPVAESAAERTLTLVFSNDTLGSLEAFGRTTATRMGGLDRRMGAVERLRREDPELILVEAGNVFFPGYLSTFDKGRCAVSLLSRMRYDACGVGLYDLYLGQDVLRQRAAGASFPFVVANFDCGLPRSVMLVRKGLRVLVVGVVDPRIQEQLPFLDPSLKARDPAAAVREVLAASRGAPPDVVVVLAAVSEDQAFTLARALPDVHVIVRVRERSQKELHEVLYRADIADGPTVVCAEKRGTCLGVARVVTGVGRPRVTRVELLPLDATVSPDPVGTALIEKVHLAYESAYRDSLAELSKEVSASFPHFAVQVMRLRLGTEVAVINRGAFLEVPEEGSFSLGDLHRIMPFKDECVKVRISGNELQQLFQKSEGADERRKLVFAGMRKDASGILVNERKLVGDQTYSVATVRYLAQGGGGYVTWPKLETGPRLKSLISAYLLDDPQPTVKRFRPWERRAVHTLRSEFDLSLSRVSQNAWVDDYASKSVPGLSGTEATRLRSALKLTYKRYGLREIFSGTVDAKYEEVDEVPAVDQLKLELLHEGNIRGTSAGFVSLQFDTTVTDNQPPGATRPFTGKLSAGKSWQLHRYLKARAGLSAVKLFSSEDAPGTYGLDTVLSYERPLLGIMEYRSRLNYFTSYAGFQIHSLDWDNLLQIRIRKKFSMVVKADLYLYRDDEVGRTAASSEVYVGFRYDTRRKWVTR